MLTFPNRYTTGLLVYITTEYLVLLRLMPVLDVSDNVHTTYRYVRRHDHAKHLRVFVSEEGGMQGLQVEMTGNDI
jgi:hypothetical protein